MKVLKFLLFFICMATFENIGAQEKIQIIRSCGGQDCACPPKEDK